jgi:hypothetical protein
VSFVCLKIYQAKYPEKNSNQSEYDLLAWTIEINTIVEMQVDCIDSELSINYNPDRDAAHITHMRRLKKKPSCRQILPNGESL